MTFRKFSFASKYADTTDRNLNSLTVWLHQHEFMHSSASTGCFYKVHRLAVLFFFCKQTRRMGRSKEKLSFAKLALMSCLFPELQPPGLGARLSMDAALILSSLSVYLTDFYPNPCLSLPNHMSLFAYPHLPAHCYSLLPCDSISGSLCYVPVALFPFLYLMYPFQLPHPATSVSLLDDCTNTFTEKSESLQSTLCTSIVRVKYQKSTAGP